MTVEVALGHVGIVLGLEVSRLARNNADWYRLLDLCGITDTLIGDSDGVYHPALRQLEEIADEEQRSISQICELFLAGAVEDCKKEGPQFIQRLLARQKNKIKK